EVVRDYGRTLRVVAPPEGVLEAGFRALVRAAARDLEREGVRPAAVERLLEVRYAGQAYEVSVPYRAGWERAFHRAHARLFGHADSRRPLEVVTLRVRARGGQEMGVVLGRTALSPNIKERRDYSCAVFDAHGALAAQAAHIPVHLGSTPLAVRAVLERVAMGPGDVVIVNDPFAGGTHLP